MDDYDYLKNDLIEAALCEYCGNCQPWNPSRHIHPWYRRQCWKCGHTEMTRVETDQRNLRDVAIEGSN